MPSRSRHRIPRAIPVLWAAALVALCATATAVGAARASSPHLGGTWSGHYSGSYSGTFTLRWRQIGAKLTGTIALSSPAGKYGVTGSIHGAAIKFGTVGAGATYTGKVSGGSSMSGSYKSPGGGGSWSAHKTKAGTS